MQASPRFTYLLYGILFLSAWGCSDQPKIPVKKEAAPALQMIIADSTRYPLASRDQLVRRLQQDWCKKISLYSPEKGTDSFELRLWKMKSDHIPVALNILKWYKGRWTQYRYTFFQAPLNAPLPQQRIDSFVVATADPQDGNWDGYLASLDIAALWAQPSQCEIPGRYDGVATECYAIELADKKKYKFLYYADPASFVQEEHHRLISNFIRIFTGTS